MMGEFEVTATIHAPIYEVWARIADIGAIAEWNPGVKKSYATSDPSTGKGATRHCDLNGSNSLDEQVVTFEKQRAITFRITKSNMPFKAADIRFKLARDDKDSATTLVTVSPVYKLKYGPVGEILDAIMIRKQYQQGMKRLLAGLKDDLECKP